MRTNEETAATPSLPITISINITITFLFLFVCSPLGNSTSAPRVDVGIGGLPKYLVLAQNMISSRKVHKQIVYMFIKSNIPNWL